MPLLESAGVEAVTMATSYLTAAAQVPIKEVGACRRWHRHQREAAYLAFQHAVVDLLLSADEASGIRPTTQGLIWVFGPFQRALKGLSSSAHDVVKGWMDVRLYGNPQPRIQAERVVEGIRQLMLTLPIGNSSERKRRRAPYQERQRTVSQAQHDFIVAVRIDLGFDRPPRQAWWQLWRHRQVDWPGGWPVDVVP